MKSKDFIPPDGELEEKKKFLQSPIEDRVKAFMKAGSVGPLNTLDYTFKVPIIVPRGDEKEENVVKESARKIIKILSDGPHPTMNPFMDKLLEYDSKDFFKCLELFIKENYSRVEIVSLDNTKDIITIRLNLSLLAINILPFFEDEAIESEKITLSLPGFNLPL